MSPASNICIHVFPGVFSLIKMLFMLNTAYNVERKYTKLRSICSGFMAMSKLFMSTNLSNVNSLAKVESR